MSSSAKLFSAVDDAASGKSSYKHSENYAERAARVRIFFGFFCFYDHGLIFLFFYLF